MLTEDHASWGYASSTGLGFSRPEIIDAHFEACAAPYRVALGQVGIRAGWRVLDAGCGSGAFLPWLADLVGPGGSLSAVDLAAEHVSGAAERMRSHGSSCELDVCQGDILDLPYADGEFDGVWCANTTQYLDDDELLRALTELRRVVRPDGIVAVKDLDASLITVRPADPFLFTDFFRSAAETPSYARQFLRTRDLYRWLRRAGLRSVTQHTMLIEHFAPLAPIAQWYYGLACARVAEQAMTMDLAGEWEPFLEPDSPANPLRDPSGYISEGNTIAVGTVPPPDGTGSTRAS